MNQDHSSFSFAYIIFRETHDDFVPGNLKLLVKNFILFDSYKAPVTRIHISKIFKQY